MRRRRSTIGKERAEKEEARTSRHDVEPDDDYYDRLEEEWAEVDATLLLDWTLIGWFMFLFPTVPYDWEQYGF